MGSGDGRLGRDGDVDPCAMIDGITNALRCERTALEGLRRVRAMAQGMQVPWAFVNDAWQDRCSSGFKGSDGAWAGGRA
eukprot:3060414-Pyramimonas_sp.AAC.1